MNLLHHKLIVSCQAQPGEPLESPIIMAKMAKAALEGGAAAIRACGTLDIKAIKDMNQCFVIGLIKRNYPDSEVFITPTIREVQELLTVDQEIIALDATLRIRPHGESIAELLSVIHQHKRFAMADISTLEEGYNAQKLGFDMVSTTLSGYTAYSPHIEGPDLQLIEDCVKNLSIPVIAEGRIRDTYDLKEVLKLNPYAVVIGSAITRPQEITRRFVQCFR